MLLSDTQALGGGGKRQKYINTNGVLCICAARGCWETQKWGGMNVDLHFNRLAYVSVFLC